MTETLLEVNNLVTSFVHEKNKIPAVDNISFSIKRGQTLGLVGESGCGKSVTSLSILGLIESPPGEISHGEIKFEGENLLQLSSESLRKIRGNKISMIFQEPMTSLNPVFTIGEQISEVFRVHQRDSKKIAREKTIEMLRLVKIPAPEKRVDEYPHQLSGGMRQRVMIAMALACRPKLLIADEPTTALDVTVQAQILELMNQLQEEIGMAVLLITHDLGVVAQVCDDVIVMYAGKIVERASVKELFTNPKHPYTVGLLNSIPKLGRRVERLATIGGNVPSLGQFPPGCRFSNRCPLSKPKCRQEEPKEIMIGSNHGVRCWFTEDVHV